MRDCLASNIAPSSVEEQHSGTGSTAFQGSSYLPVIRKRGVPGPSPISSSEGQGIWRVVWPSNGLSFWF